VYGLLWVSHRQDERNHWGTGVVRGQLLCCFTSWRVDNGADSPPALARVGTGEQSSRHVGFARCRDRFERDLLPACSERWPRFATGRVGRLAENKPRDHLSASIQNSPTRTDVSSKSRVRNCLTLERVAPSPLLTNDTGRCCFQRVTEIAGTAYLRHLVEVAPRKAPPPTIVMVSDSKPFWDASQNSASRDDVDICAAARAVACLQLWGLRIRSLDAICCRRLLISRDEPAGESRTATQMSRRTALSATHRLRQGRPNAAERSCRPPGRTDQKLSGNILDPDRHARLAWKRRSPPRNQPSRGGPEWSLNPPLS